MDFLIDCGADIHIYLISFGQETDKRDGFCISAKVIGGRQPIDPKNRYNVRFSCDKTNVSNICQKETSLSISNN